jgi:hypothetical protein
VKTVTMSRAGLSRLRVALYLALAAAWIFIAIAQFMSDTANASSGDDATAEMPLHEEWRALPVSVIG